MSRYIYYSIETGRIVSESPVREIQQKGVAELLADVPVGIGRSHFVANGHLTPKGERPSEFHVFDWQTKQWHDPRTAASEWALVRAERTARLAASDWAVIRAAETRAAVSQPWRDYRQALRDITLQPDPFNINWPTPP